MPSVVASFLYIDFIYFTYFAAETCDDRLGSVDLIVPLVDASQHLLQRHLAATGIIGNSRDRDVLLRLTHGRSSLGFKSAPPSSLKCRFCNFTAKFASWVRDTFMTARGREKQID